MGFRMNHISFDGMQFEHTNFFVKGDTVKVNVSFGTGKGSGKHGNLSVSVGRGVWGVWGGVGRCGEVRGGVWCVGVLGCWCVGCCGGVCVCCCVVATAQSDCVTRGLSLSLTVSTPFGVGGLCGACGACERVARLCLCAVACCVVGCVVIVERVSLSLSPCPPLVRSFGVVVGSACVWCVHSFGALLLHHTAFGESSSGAPPLVSFGRGAFAPVCLCACVGLSLCLSSV